MTFTRHLLADPAPPRRFDESALTSYYVAPITHISPRSLLACQMASSSSLQLNRQLQSLRKHPVDGFSAGLVDDQNIYEWEFTIFGPPDTLYEGGFFRATMSFPQDFPLSPPKMKFLTEMWHPNSESTVLLDCVHEASTRKRSERRIERILFFCPGRRDARCWGGCARMLCERG